MVRRHGLSHTRVYNIWRAMRRRCSDPKHDRYKHYGGRGITVCEEWENSITSFYNWAMENGYSDKLQIDRVDNDGNYEPSNCRFTTPSENLRNRPSNGSRYIEYQGVRLHLAAWARWTGISRAAIARRLGYGWSVERALTVPINAKFHRKIASSTPDGSSPFP